MKRLLQIALLILLQQAAFADTLTVKQDSTGDYIQIQDAINAAAIWDTVLVWPGTYYEHLRFNGKNITLASLMLITNDPSYQLNTIIDGNHNDRCITIDDYNSGATVYGFTIQNGKNEVGGGIRIYRSEAQIINNIIKNNFSDKIGGGIACHDNCEVLLAGNRISNNHSYLYAGGVSCTGNSRITFDSINRNSIYLNYSSTGCDYLKDVTIPPVVIYIDTSTILNPGRYFFYAMDDEGYFLDEIDLHVANALLEPFDDDLYVNPVTGDNANSGLSPDEPLQTIAFALGKIAIDSTDKNTIHLANGIYSDSTNDEKFPLNVRQFTNVVGQSRDGVILDGNRNIHILFGNNVITDYSFQRMTLQGGPIPTYESFESKKQLARLYTRNHRFLLDSLVFRDSYAHFAVGILTYYQADSSVVRNCEFYGNKGGHSIRTAATNRFYKLSNNKFYHNLPDYNEPDHPKGVTFSTGGNGVGVIQNSLFYENESATISAWTYPNLYLVNCTFTNNSIIESWASLGVFDADMHLYNCISYNEGTVPLAIAMVEPQKEIVSHLNIYNSLIEGGEPSINIDWQCDGDTWCKVHYDETNIDADPIFLGKWEHPYQIADGSPCIDAGTLAKLPGFIELPETDLAGNPRIVGDSIDMGAYEWNPTVGVDENIYQPIKSDKPKLLHAAPNPFSTSTTISAQWDFTGHVQIEIYNNAGLRVNVLKSGKSTGIGSLTANWFGNDQNRNELPAGIYYVIMFWNDKEVENLKLIRQ